MAISVNTGHRCPRCKGSIDTVYNINREKYGNDYEPWDYQDESSMYKCLNESCGASDYADYFWYWEVELNDEKCVKCGSKHLEGEYFDYFSGSLELKCNDCKHIFKAEID